MTAAGGSGGNGWRDELALALLVLPFAMAFCPVTAEAARAGFDVLASAPEWYQTGFGVGLGAAFGIRNLGGWLSRMLQRAR